MPGATITHFRIVLLLILVAVLGAPPLCSQADSELPPPAVVVRAFFQALGDERWTDAVLLLDLTDLDTYRHLRADAARRPISELTVDQLLRADSELPRAVAEYDVKRSRAQRAAFGNYLSREFAGIQSADDLDTLPLREVGIRWLQAQHPAYRLREQLRLKGCVVPAGLDSAFRVAPVGIRGTIVHGDTALVVFRNPWHSFPDSGFMRVTPPIVRVLHQANGWRIAAHHDLVQQAAVTMSIQRCPDAATAVPKRQD